MSWHLLRGLCRWYMPTAIFRQLNNRASERSFHKSAGQRAARIKHPTVVLTSTLSLCIWWRILWSKNRNKPPAYASSLGKYFSFLIVSSCNFSRLGKTSPLLQFAEYPQDPQDLRVSDELADYCQSRLSQRISGCGWKGSKYSPCDSPLNPRALVHCQDMAKLWVQVLLVGSIEIAELLHHCRLELPPRLPHVIIIVVPFKIIAHAIEFRPYWCRWIIVETGMFSKEVIDMICMPWPSLPICFRSLARLFSSFAWKTNMPWGLSKAARMAKQQI